MSTTMTQGARAPSDGALYRAIWRWHFYAGLILVPFMLLLSITGFIYLFKDEIDRTAYAKWNVVAVPAGGSSLPPSQLVANALQAAPGSTVAAYRDPLTVDGSARIRVNDGSGGMLVYLDPFSGAVLGSVARDGEFSQFVRKLHSLEFFGAGPNRLIEAAAGFAMVLVITGIYLWWPRGRRGGVVTVRATPAKRMFWRDLHAVTGAFAGVLILFLALSGMPWSGYWGGQFNALATSWGIGYPAALWDDVPVSDEHAGHVMDQTAWTIEQSPMPMSTATGMAPTGIDQVVALAKSSGISPGFEVTFPDGPTGVFTAAVYPDDVNLQRTIHVDQYSGRALVDLGFAEYGLVAKISEWAIGVHMGQMYGLANQLVMAGTCLAIMLVSVSGMVMWWKRRPTGRLGVPPAPSDRRVYAGLWTAAAIVGVLFPLTGIAILVMLALDLLVIRTIPPLRRAFA